MIENPYKSPEAVDDHKSLPWWAIGWVKPTRECFGDVIATAGIGLWLAQRLESRYGDASLGNLDMVFVASILLFVGGCIADYRHRTAIFPLWSKQRTSSALIGAGLGLAGAAAIEMLIGSGDWDLAAMLPVALGLAILGQALAYRDQYRTSHAE